MTEKEFHRQRRMFAMNDEGQTAVAAPNDERSHAEWLLADFGITKPGLRGYVDRTGIYFYRDGWDATDEDWARVRPLVRFFAELEDLDGKEGVYQGVVPGEPGTRWEGKKKLGLVRDFL